MEHNVDMRRVAIALLLAFAAACSKEHAARPKVVAKKKPIAPVTAGRADVGDVMPGYSTDYLNGNRFDLAAEKGNVVLLNLWATWCVPCRYEIPELQKLHDRYASRGFKVIGVSIDEGVDSVKQFAEEEKITYPIALDADGHLANVLQTTVLPTSVVIDRNGRIVWRKIGALMPNEIASLDSLVKRTLGGTNKS